MHITWRHVHRQAGGNCTDAQLYFWQIFQFFIFIQMGPGPTHPLPNNFWIFGIFLTLQSTLRQTIAQWVFSSSWIIIVQTSFVTEIYILIPRADTRMYCHVASTVISRQTSFATNLTPARVAATVHGFMSTKVRHSRKAPTTL